jgi:hypothetical protein
LSRSALPLVVRLVPLVVGLVLEVARGLAMTLGCLGVAEHVGDLGRLALAARGALVSRGGPIVRSALPGALIPVVGSHMEQSSTGGVESAVVAAFFIPGCTPGVEAEGVYARIVAAAAADTGDPPRPVRIFRLSFRHEGADLEAEVGMPDPVQGWTVLAILDLGRESPYMLHCRSTGGSSGQVLVRKPVYSVTEFAAAPPRKRGLE